MTNETSTSETMTSESSSTEKFFNFREAKSRLFALLSAWDGELTATRERRNLRYIDVNAKELRERQIIAPDETFVPIRVIDTNIRREQPGLSAYLSQSPRLAIFKCNDVPHLDTQEVEREFTTGMKYEGWELEHIKTYDGAQTHGWDSVEVVLNLTKPLHVSIEHIGHDRLFFNKDVQDIQNSPLVIRSYKITASEADTFKTRYSFNSEQVDKLLKDRLKNRPDETVEIYKCFYKNSSGDEYVYVAWFAKECDDWLKKPEKLYLGRAKQAPPGLSSQAQMGGLNFAAPSAPLETSAPLAAGEEETGKKDSSITFAAPKGPIATSIGEGQEETSGGSNLTPQLGLSEMPSAAWEDIYETDYPIIILPYLETEQEAITDHKSRTFLDQDKQEALTSLWSAFVNGTNRAANAYASPKNPRGGGAIKQLALTLTNGAVYSEPLDFWSSPYPNPVMLSAAQALDIQNSQEAGQISFAAQNRKDSRKTATEISASLQQASLLGSVQLVQVSIYFRRVYALAWRIIQSRALQDKLRFLRNIETGENNKQIVGLTYTVFPAGDVDVVLRAQKLQRMMQFWPVVATTPAGTPFLKKLLQLGFPEEAEELLKTLEAESQRKTIIASLLQIVKGSVTQPEFSQLSPEEQQNLGQILQAAQASLQQP